MATLPSGNSATTGSITNPSTTNAQQKTNWSNLITFLSDLLGTDSANKSAARTALGATTLGNSLFTAASAVAARSSLGVGQSSVVKGLTGNVNATTPLTKYDLSAHAVVLQDTNGAAVIRQNTGTLTCDLGLAGSASNGRDQSGAFTANSWVYLYFIWNGTTLATLASLTGPTSFSGSTLPSGYTHWAFATCLRWNASSQIVPCLVRGRAVSYNAQTTVVNGSSPTVSTAVNVASAVPPIAQSFLLTLNAIAGSTNASGVLDMTTFIEAVSGSTLHSSRFAIVGAASSAQYGCGPQVYVPNVNQSYNYYSTVSIGSGPSLVQSISSFIIPNGDS